MTKNNAKVADDFSRKFRVVVNVLGVPELSEHAVFRDFRHCAETADVVVSKIFRITHQESKLNVTLSPSQHIIPFSH